MTEWQDISDAPRDGSVVEITAIEDDGAVFEIHRMQWGHVQRNALFAPGQVGMWVDPGGNYTWREGEGGPTHFRPSPPTSGDE